MSFACTNAVSSLRIAAVLLAASVMPGLAGAEEKPLWEAGVGAAALSFPAYRGSDTVQNLAMPVPYFVYRGDFFKADRHGIRGNLFDSDRIDLSLSLSGSPPADSEDVPARRGMPDLKTTFEFGPQVDVTLWRSENRARFLKLRMPMRAAFALEPSPEPIGWIFSPNLNLDITDVAGLPGWNFGFLAGPIFATKKQHQYFYGVDQRYATMSRPAYEASGGYSGTQFLMSVSKRFRHTWLGAYARYDDLHGTSFDDSPLLKQRSFATVGIAVSWVLGESTTRVQADD